MCYNRDIRRRRKAISPFLIALSERCRRVLTQLLLASEALSAAEVGRQAGLSPAQVRYCLRDVQPWLRERGLALRQTPRVGMRIEGTDAFRRRVLEEVRALEGGQLALTHEERGSLLLLRLLVSDKPVSESALSRELGVSRSSLFRDLAQARRWLQARGLRSVTRRGKGLTVEGDEVRWREAVGELLEANLDQAALIAACVQAGAQTSLLAAQGSRFLSAASAFLRALDLAASERLVSGLEQRLGGAFPDEARVRLVLHLGLALFRLRGGRPAADEAGAAESTPGAESPALGRAMQWLRQATGEALPAAEAAYLTRLLQQALAEGLVARDDAAAPGDQPSGRALELAAALTKEAAKYLNARLFHDEELANCLALELLVPAGSSTGGNARRLSDAAGAALAPDASRGANPLYGFTLRVLGPILEHNGHPPGQRLAAAIAMHLQTALERHGRDSPRRRVWVVCGAGVATARNLITRLNLHLPQLEIVGLASAFELARDPSLLSGADAIVSTVPLDWLSTLPVLCVSPLLTAADVALLRRSLALDAPRAPAEAAFSASRRSPGEAALSASRRSPGETAARASTDALAELLSPRTIQTGVVAETWEQVVDRAGALLLEAGAAWPSYTEAMKDMIRLYGPYVVIAPGAALLHAGPEMGGKRLCMSLVVLQRPVAFGHAAHDPVHVALAFSSIDHTTHVRAVGDAIALLGDARAVRAMRRAATPEDALAAIRSARG